MRALSGNEQGIEKSSYKRSFEENENTLPSKKRFASERAFQAYLDCKTVISATTDLASDIEMIEFMEEGPDSEEANMETETNLEIACIDTPDTSEDDEAVSYEVPSLIKIAALDEVNKCLASLRVSPVSNIRKSNLPDKYGRALNKLRTNFQTLSRYKLPACSSNCLDCKNLIIDAEKVFKDSSDQVKYLILSSMPRTLTKRQAKKYLIVDTAWFRKHFN